MKLTFEAPLPPRELSPNARVHWRAKAKATAAYRDQVRILCWSALMIRGQYWLAPDHARLDVTFVVPDKRRRDKTNLASAFKAGLDGIVDAGIIKDDSHECCDDQYHIRYEKGESRVEVEIET